ncbi:PP2C family protein-serine/threonine phosphatase [Nonomuraea purpurea]|uniref:PP2C family protein-serine/threonine phosphatase n=1 Tax=Nonomuraea purpurea TaxID=1849276 RepID=A0ABV8GDZ4_9ACTN
MTDDGQRRRGLSFLSTPVFVVGLAVVTVAVVGLDALTHTSVRLLPLLIFLPSIVSGLGTVWQTFIASLWTLAVVTTTLVYVDTAPADTVLAAGFTAMFGTLSLVGCRYRVRREEEVHRLRSAAAALQRLIVRPLPLRTGDTVVDGLYQPVEEDAMVGGDLYDVAPSPYGTRLLIGDVQGKGLPAIGTALAVLGSFREAAYRETTLTGLVEALEKAVVRQNAFAAHTGEPERLVTALVLGIGRGLGVEAVNCGHIAPYLIRDSQARQVDLGEPGVPLGIAGLAPEPRRCVRFAFPLRATLLLCTDGVTEARDQRGRFYPLEERLCAWAEEPPERLAAALDANLRDFTRGAPRDDIAVLTLRRAETDHHGGS